jgi:outer membrane receptor protein involved in Fe transport
MRWSLVFFFAAVLSAQSLGTVRGVVHDPQHRPLDNATVTLRGANGTWSKAARTDSNGEFTIDDLPEGAATLNVGAEGFAALDQQINVSRDRTPVLHLQMALPEVKQTVQVSGALSRLNAQTSTVGTSVTPQEIAQTPGADQSNSLAMITDFTPGATMVHDMLHMRGGHQVSWFLDGIPVVNTNIAANVAPLVNPKNVEELEVERGGFSGQYGDRTYGFFNAVTPSGFELNNEGEVIASLGDFWTTDDQFKAGGHTQRFAYYASVDANRSELGLAAPISQLIHDQTSGAGGFLSLMYNATSKDQLRWVVSLRENHYQIPNTPDQQVAGIRDLDLERDHLAGFYWMHTFSDGVLFTVSPYFHFNSAHYIGGPRDTPFILDDNNRSNYFGARPVLQRQKGRHNARVGLDVWWQHDNSFFALTGNPGSELLAQQGVHGANSNALFMEDQYRATSWLTLDLGLRLTHYDGLVNENAADPRVGGAIRVPHLNWVLHGYYAYYYQPPPLDSLAGPLLQFALAQGYGFIRLAGERDIQHDIGLTIPLRGWSLEMDHFHTSARNFLDHDVVGNSGIFIPLTDLGAIVGGTEVSVRSPTMFRVAQIRMAYSNQLAQGIGPVTGGLLQDSSLGNFLLDHDQRNTVSAVLSLTLPKRIWMTPAYQFGSGFLNANGPSHLPPHSTFDLSIGKRFGESWTVSASAVNVANTRYLVDTSNTFGGTHYINLREVYGEVRYRFKF